MTTSRSLLPIAFAILATSFSVPAVADSAKRCASELAHANAEMNAAKAAGLGGVVDIVEAASLITAAATQQQFKRYEGCADKARRARVHIAKAMKR